MSARRCTGLHLAAAAGGEVVGARGPTAGGCDPGGAGRGDRGRRLIAARLCPGQRRTRLLPASLGGVRQGRTSRPRLQLRRRRPPLHASRPLDFFLRQAAALSSVAADPQATSLQLFGESGLRLRGSAGRGSPGLPSMRPITGTGRSRSRRASASTAPPPVASGVRASPALGSSDTGKAPLPIWLVVTGSTRPRRRAAVPRDRRQQPLGHAAISCAAESTAAAPAAAAASRSGSA